METLTNGLSQGDFTLLRVLYNGGMTDILTLIGSLGGGPITSTQLPLSISGGVLSIDLSSSSNTVAMNTAIANALVSYVTSTALTNALAAYTDTTTLTTLLQSKISTNHEANKIGNANVAFGAFDINTQTVTLQNANGVTAVLSVDIGGYLNIGADGVITVPILNLWSFLALKMKVGARSMKQLPSASASSVASGIALRATFLTTTSIASRAIHM